MQPNENIFRFFSGRELKGNPIINEWIASQRSVKTMGFAANLKGHKGCVNTLAFDASGRYLVSGSDDGSCKIWDTDALTCLNTIPGHISNVFTASFFPVDDIGTIISGGNDADIRLNRLEPKETTVYRHHTMKVLKISPRPFDAFSFLSCSADGTLRFFDTRLKYNKTYNRALGATETRSIVPQIFGGGRALADDDDTEETRSSLLLNYNLVLPAKKYSVLYDTQWHPRDPNLFIVASDFGCVRMFDMRRLDPSKNPLDCYVNVYSNISKNPNKRYEITGCSFSKDGTEILATCLYDSIYVFDTDANFEEHYNYNDYSNLKNFAPPSGDMSSEDLDSCDEDDEPMSLMEMLQLQRDRNMPVASSASSDSSEEDSAGDGIARNSFDSLSLSSSTASGASSNDSSTSHSDSDDVGADVVTVDDVMAEDILGEDDEISLFSTERDPPSSSFSSDVFDGRDYEINNVVDIASTILERNPSMASRSWFNLSRTFSAASASNSNSSNFNTTNATSARETGTVQGAAERREEFYLSDVFSLPDHPRKNSNDDAVASVRNNSASMAVRDDDSDDSRVGAKKRQMDEPAMGENETRKKLKSNEQLDVSDEDESEMPQLNTNDLLGDDTDFRNVHAEQELLDSESRETGGVMRLLRTCLKSGRDEDSSLEFRKNKIASDDGGECVTGGQGSAQFSLVDDTVGTVSGPHPILEEIAEREWQTERAARASEQAAITFARRKANYLTVEPDHIAPDDTRSYKYEYIGHVSNQTIKSVYFLGNDSEFIASGSDDAKVYIWSKKSQDLVNILIGHHEIVNCVASQTSSPLIATSGLDHKIKLWTNKGEYQKEAIEQRERKMRKLVRANQREVEEVEHLASENSMNSDTRCSIQ